MKLLVVCLTLLLSLGVFAEQRATVCQDGIGSQIIIKYLKSYTSESKHYINTEYIITGPASEKGLSWGYGDPYSQTTGILRPDGVLYISFMHAKSSLFFTASWENGDSTLVIRRYGEKEFWRFQNCRDMYI